MAATDISDTEKITLAVEPDPPVAVPTLDERALPFSFAKRHGVLIREIVDGANQATSLEGLVR